MGLGKTMTSLAKFQEDGFDPSKHRLLVVCLAGNKQSKTGKTYDWQSEIEKWYEIDCKVLDDGSEKNYKSITNENIRAMTISFQSLWRLENIDKKFLKKFIDDSWYIIIDESTMIKHHNSKVTKFSIKMMAKAKHKLILTGSLFAGGYEFIWSQLKVLGYEGDYKSFVNTYCIEETHVSKVEGQPDRSYKIIVGYKNRDQLNELARSYGIFMDTEEAYDLPEQTFITVNTSVSKEYKLMREDRVIDGVRAPNAGTLRMRLKQLCSGFMGSGTEYYEYHKNKINALEDILMETEDRIIIFYNYVPEADMIAELCEKLNRPFAFYNGSSKEKDKFVNTEGCILIGNYASLSIGTDGLQNVCNKVVYYAPPDSYEFWIQSLSRTWRIGQKNKCIYYKFIAKNSVEVANYKALDESKDFDDEFFINNL